MSAPVPNPFFATIDCPVCDSNKLKPYFKISFGELEEHTPDYSCVGVDKSTQLYVTECRSCGFVFVNPRIRPEFESLIYNEAKRATHEKKHRRTEAETRVLNRNARRSSVSRLLLLLSLLDEGQADISFLDFGCGLGNLLTLAEAFEIESFGVDLDQDRLDYCSKLGLKVSRPAEFEKKFPATRVDIITMQNVLEHIIDLRQVMDFIRAHSKPGTILYVDGLTPRIIDMEQRRGKFDMAHFVEHVNYFPSGAIDLLMKKYGFSRVRKREFALFQLKDFIKGFSSYVAHNWIGTLSRGTFYRLYRRDE